MEHPQDGVIAVSELSDMKLLMWPILQPGRALQSCVHGSLKHRVPAGAQ
jgi:hypothetical protein